jgi:hypothetical protein
LQLVEHGDEVPEVAAQPVEAPANDHVNLAALGMGEQFVQGRSRVLRTRDSVVDVRDRCPAPTLDVPAEFLQLVLGMLLLGTDASIEGGTHTAIINVIALLSTRAFIERGSDRSTALSDGASLQHLLSPGIHSSRRTTCDAGGRGKHLLIAVGGSLFAAKRRRRRHVFSGLFMESGDLE